MSPIRGGRYFRGVTSLHTLQAEKLRNKMNKKCLNDFYDNIKTCKVSDNNNLKKIDLSDILHCKYR